ncbi:putative Uncharacterized oxidoreductase [Glarea lozoyensis 74030]|uniref:Putative Uncharacterized oxidoreductase n=1 Tax=Glarea lozoyensis (strain ATCC 74030 / MF5533) TaxID=1104152 RepID=H0EN34_GLAL7|nr:putative Uncharacterized oxidoreductase [Glarea lozoyensis 74030]
MSKIGDFPLKDKIAVVTGGGSGINLCFAQLAVQKGAKVIIADLKLTPEAEKFINSEAASAIFTKCDVTRRADLENLIRVSEENYGDVPDVYIAGAGVFEPSWSNFWDDTEEDGYAALDVNVTHAIKLTRIAMRALLRKGKKGVILITASLAGMVATPLWLSRPDKMTQFGYDPAHTITPERVAADMYELVTDGQYGGGTCLENSAAGTRVLGTWNIEAPKSAGTKVPQSVKDVNYRSMIEIMGREKGAKL